MNKKLDLKHIPYNLKLKTRARELRKKETEAEKFLWNNFLKYKNIIKYKFTRQKPIDYFIADFYCSKLLLVIEIDGDIHKSLKERDLERTNILEQKYNLKVVRFKNDDILNGIDKVKKEIIAIINNREHVVLFHPDKGD